MLLHCVVEGQLQASHVYTRVFLFVCCFVLFCFVVVVGFCFVLFCFFLGGRGGGGGGGAKQPDNDWLAGLESYTPLQHISVITRIGREFLENIQGRGGGGGGEVFQTRHDRKQEA